MSHAIFNFCRWLLCGLAALLSAGSLSAQSTSYTLDVDFETGVGNFIWAINGTAVGSGGGTGAEIGLFQVAGDGVDTTGNVVVHPANSQTARVFGYPLSGTNAVTLPSGWYMVKEWHTANNLASGGGWFVYDRTWYFVGEPEKFVRVIVINGDDREYTLRYSSDISGRAQPNGGATTNDYDLDDLETAKARMWLETDVTYAELYGEEYFLHGGTFYKGNSDMGRSLTYVWGFDVGAFSDDDAKAPPNTFTVTIPFETASKRKLVDVTLDNSDWISPTSPTPEDPGSPPEIKQVPVPPVQESRRRVTQQQQRLSDPTTGLPPTQTIRFPSIGTDLTEVPSTNDGKAVVEALKEIERRNGLRSDQQQLQGAAGSEVAEGQLGAAALGGAVAGQMGGKGDGAGVASKAPYASKGAAPSALGYTVGGGSAPTLSVAMPASFGGATFDFNPFTSERLGPIASWFRAAMAWLTIVVIGAWVWNELDVKAYQAGTAPQAKGNPIVGGTGAQVTALTAAAAMTTAIVALSVALLAWSFGEITLPAIFSAITTNPTASMPAGVLWMVDQLFPVATIITACVARLAWKLYCVPLFAACMAVVRFIVP